MVLLLMMVDLSKMSKDVRPITGATFIMDIVATWLRTGQRFEFLGAVRGQSFVHRSPDMTQLMVIKMSLREKLTILDKLDLETLRLLETRVDVVKEIGRSNV